MKFLVLALCVCAVSAAPAYKPFQAVAQPVAKAAAVAAQPFVQAANVVAKAGGSSDGEASIVRSDSDIRPDGYEYNFETGNGISAQQSGSLKTVDNQQVLSIQGSYQYLAPDNTAVKFVYIADENGYQPQSDLLPVAPPVPVEIARALEYIAAHPQQSEKKF